MCLQTGLLAVLPTETARCGGINVKRRLGVVFAGLLLFTLGVIYYFNESLLFRITPHVGTGAIKQYPACPIPQLEPFHESILDLVDSKEPPPGYNCGYPFLFNSTLQSTIIPAKGPDYFRDEGYEYCCYRTVARDESADNPDCEEILSPECFPLHFTNETKIPNGHEFIAIYCKKNSSQLETLVDVHAFVHLKPNWNRNRNKEMEEKFNVVIFGLDAMSRMNFLRTMPQSYSFLKNEMEAVEMLGYNKVGGIWLQFRLYTKTLENTVPNMFPLLMSGMPSDFNCGSDFLDCPFIWKKYSKQGYYTMSSEDCSHVSLLGWNFKQQPTHYYFRPLNHFADTNFRSYTCHGPRLTFQFLLDYMEKYVETMSRNKKKFFEFTWATGLTHEHINAPRHGDPHLLKSLRWLKGSGYLNNTIFILMSDHGSRSGSIRSRIQGQLEDRLPFMYFVLPDSFKTKYKRAYMNLVYNADKLITTYDLHKSLKEILNLEMIGGNKLLEREDDLSRLGRNLTRGISLFLPIPEFRTCAMAGIDMIFCSCTYAELVEVSDPEIDAVGKAKVAVSHINSILGVNINSIITTNHSCAHLELHNVSMAHRAGFSPDKRKGYIINFETRPGGAQFEAMIKRDIHGGSWTATDPIVRTNRYGNQSHCVQDSKLKPYCYCLQ